MRKKKYTFIDLFAGCGGLSEGFMSSGHFQSLAHVEWEFPMVQTLRNRLIQRWGETEESANKKVILFDIQNTDELINGHWSEDSITKYGKNNADNVSKGLKAIVGKKSVDFIIGGPPCQAYSIHGRATDKHSMNNDYRNYLFESFVKVVDYFKPRAFIFENVPGILSARPGDGELVVDKIRNAFNNAGYIILDDLKKAAIDMSEYGIPQKRKRIIILGLNKEIYGEQSCKQLLSDFYNVLLPKRKLQKKATVFEAIGDLPKLYPLKNGEIIRLNGKKYSHTFSNIPVNNHFPRYHSVRDIKIFNLLSNDIATGNNKFTSTESLKDLYTSLTGKESNIHKFHVLRWNEPSNLIPAHLFKDGLRHIHPDPNQARTITVREAARLQTFDDDFEFISKSNLDYKMIGNAVPPKFSKIIAETIKELLF